MVDDVWALSDQATMKHRHLVGTRSDQVCFGI